MSEDVTQRFEGPAMGGPPESEPGEQIGVPPKEAVTWGMLCHLCALAGLIGIPFGTILGPLVIWLIKRNDHPFVDQQGKEALNFQISMAIYAIAALIVCSLLFVVLIGFLLIIPLFLGWVLFDLVMVIMASVKASEGEPFHYPVSIRFFR